MAIDILKKCSLFFELYDNEIEKIIKSCAVNTVPAQTEIIKENEMGNEFYIILDGEAEVSKLSFSEGSEEPEKIVLGELKSGDVFGELILLNDNLRTATVTSKMPTDLLVVNQETIYSLYQYQTKIFSILLLNLSRILSHKLKMTTKRLEETRDYKNEFIKKVV